MATEFFDQEAPDAREPEDWFFTFGIGQGRLAEHYVVLTGSAQSTRDEMIKMFGRMWSTQYSRKRFDEVQAKSRTVYTELML